MRRLFLLAGIWGWSFLFIKVAVGGMPPATVACARVALGMIVLLAVVRLRGLRLPAGREAWRHFAVVGLFGSALPFTLLAWGEQHISSALTAVLNAATPLFAALLVAVFLGQRLRRSQSVGLLLGFVGVGVAAGLGASDLSGSSLAGEAAAVGAGACYAIAITYGKRHLSDLSPLVAAAGQLVTATVLALPFAVVSTAREGIELTPRRLLAVCLLGFLGTGLAYVLFYRVMADLGPTMTAAVTYLVPITAVTVGLLFLHEPFHLRLVAGGALVVGGILLLNGRGVRAPAFEPEGAPEAVPH
jgi:drug/metabolite transporter (DMT)-like permease